MTTKELLMRISINLVLLISVLNAWWFLALPVALVGLWKYDTFVESIIAGILYDSLFGLVPSEGIAGYGATIVSILLYAGMIFVKKIIRK